MKHLKRFNESSSERMTTEEINTMLDTIEDIFLDIKDDGFRLDYSAFHEVSISVVYDITNGIKLGHHTEEECSNWDYNDDGGSYSDITSAEAIKIGNKYYLDL